MEPTHTTKIFKAPAPHMVGDGFRVHNFFPGGYEIDMNPFFLMDYGSKIQFSARKNPRGVGIYPHRGLETITLAYYGAVSHHDSSGHSGTIYPGDAQWMTAGSGILHKEYHEQEYSLKGGPFQMVQLWVNLPAIHKMTRPRYQSVTRPDMEKFELPDGGEIEVIAGNYQGKKGIAQTFTPIELYNARINEGSKASFSFPGSYNTGIMVIAGSILLNDQETIQTDQFIYFGKNMQPIEIKALNDSILLVLSGAPIDEPIVQYGPFLMNTEAEIHQAIADYNEGRFGYLEE